MRGALYCRHTYGRTHERALNCRHTYGGTNERDFILQTYLSNAMIVCELLYQCKGTAVYVMGQERMW